MLRASVWLALLSSLLLSSCGFHLRGDLPLSHFPAMYIQSERHSELAALVAARLKHNKVQLLDSYQQTTPMLQLIDDSLERRNLTLFPNGQVAEYELIYKVRYALTMPDGEPQQYQFELFRDYQDDPNRALAKAKELDLMLGELRQQAANRILRQLARLH
ncbi:LPS-assembly lipoprotein LptE [Rheinheimera maricola]|uniref:LPS-assembly lipoprotein LptE n=1 Tax=Rheinheimera maricola TaxID=2793282 RepID=A0ABS7XBJ3_9GAMM|nr:LPS assembly lipoprotein LptE [Rheinheimera maricola]MBZ9612926.1 LPS assembly lipoprotein LptE [Rheinheimera maricola]